MYKSGKYTQKAISEIFGVTEQTIRKYMKKHNIVSPNAPKPRKLTIDLINYEFAMRGYILLTSEYKNTGEKLKYICLNHKDKGVLEITYGQFYVGKGCWYCSYEHRANKQRLSYECVKSEFEKRGYKLISKIYIDSGKKLQFICNKHENMGIQEIRYNNLKQGAGCVYCRQGGHYNLTVANRNKDEFINTKTIVYFIKCCDENEKFYKIGLTTNSVAIRFLYKSSLPYDYTILKEIHTNLYNAIYLEKELHDICKKYSYKPRKAFKGWTECFLKLDIDDIEDYLTKNKIS